MTRMNVKLRELIERVNTFGADNVRKAVKREAKHEIERIKDRLEWELAQIKEYGR